MKVRLIIQASEDCINEYITFSEDFDDPIGDFVIPGMVVVCDKVIEMDEIPGFPLEYTFKKTNF